MNSGEAWRLQNSVGQRLHWGALLMTARAMNDGATVPAWAWRHAAIDTTVRGVFLTGTTINDEAEVVAKINGRSAPERAVLSNSGDIDLAITVFLPAAARPRVRAALRGGHGRRDALSGRRVRVLACRGGGAALVERGDGTTVYELPTLRRLGGLSGAGAVRVVASWSGDALAAHAHDGAVRVWRRRGDDVVTTLPVECAALAIADDGTRAAALRPDGSIVALDLTAAGAAARVLGTVPGGGEGWLAGNGDLSLLLYGRGGAWIDPQAMLAWDGGLCWAASGDDRPVSALAGPQRCWFATEQGLVGRDAEGAEVSLPGDGGETLAYGRGGGALLVTRAERFTGPCAPRSAAASWQKRTWTCWPSALSRSTTTWASGSRSARTSP